jgi:hypothetical protein
MPIRYAVDRGPLGVSHNNAVGQALIASATAAWQAVPTTAIRFSNAGGISLGLDDDDQDVNTLPEYAAVEAACLNGDHSPIIFDANGRLLRDLGFDPLVLGFARSCALDRVTGHIRSALLLLNGLCLTSPGLSLDEFEETVAHEFGHFIGLDHSQTLDVMNRPAGFCDLETLTSLPIMFPFAYCQARKPLGLPVLAPDDAAWVSKLYPSASFSSTYGTISGFIYFTDGLSQFQGANVLAQRVDDPGTPEDESKRIVVTAVSGQSFTSNPGQSLTGDNTGGSSFGTRDPGVIGFYEIPVPAGTYTVYVDNIRSEFTGGSSVGPLDPPAPFFFPEFWNQSESSSDNSDTRDPITIVAGETQLTLNILNCP